MACPLLRKFYYSLITILVGKPFGVAILIPIAIGMCRNSGNERKKNLRFEEIHPARAGSIIRGCFSWKEKQIPFAISPAHAGLLLFAFKK